MEWSIRKMRYCSDIEERMVSLGENLVSGLFLLLLKFFLQNMYCTNMFMPEAVFNLCRIIIINFSFFIIIRKITAF